MEATKPGQPLAVKVASASVVEARPKAAPQVVQEDDILDAGSAELVEGEVNQEVGGEENASGNIFDDDDIFAGEDAFTASPANAAMSELDDAGNVEVVVGEEGSDASVGGEVEVEAEGEEEGEATFQIYSHDCLRCTELVPGLKKSEYIKARSFKKCHYENGNKDCPAKTVQIVVGLPIPKIVKAYMDAFINGDNVTLANIQARLATKDEGQRELANAAIRRALARHLAGSQ